MSKHQDKKTELLQILWDVEALRNDCRDRIETIREILKQSDAKILNPLTTEEEMILEELRAQLEDIKETNFLDIDRLDSVFVSLKSICGDTESDTYKESSYFDDANITF